MSEISKTLVSPPLVRICDAGLTEDEHLQCDFSSSYAYEAYTTLKYNFELYEFKVRSLCSNARTSDWSKTVTLPADKISTKSDDPDAPNFNKIHNIVVTRENGNVIGKVNIVTGLSKIIGLDKIVYIDHDGAGYADATFSVENIENQLNTTHNVMFTKWKINKVEKLDRKAYCEKNYPNGVKFTSENYSEEINKIYHGIKDNPTEKIFIITKFNSSKYGYYLNGYAVKGKFMVLMGGDLPTFTHECGHILNLPHTFCCTDSPVPPNCSPVVGNRCMDKYSTKNYMDYRQYTNSPQRTHFDYYQWKTAYQASY